MDREQHFAAITRMLAKYEPGDLLLLSDIGDALTGLEDYYLASPACVDFIAWLQALIRQNLTGPASDGFQDLVGAALALLQKWKPNLKPQARQRLEADMSAFHPDPLVVARAKAEPSGGSANDVFQSDETFTLFMTEARERLSQAQELVLALEKNPGDAESLSALFRVFHTIKGESGFLHLVHLGELTHHLENILDLLRQEKLELDRTLVDVLLSGIDRSRQILQSMQGGDRDTAIDDDLAAFIEGLNSISAQVQPALGSVLINTGKLQEKDVESILAQQRSKVFNERFGEIAVKEKLISDADLHSALERQSRSAEAKVIVPGKAAGMDGLQDEIIKVRLEKVNFLVDMIGELTIALGQVAEDSLAMAQVRKITRGLQFGAMELRTDTMQGLFSTLRRIIRDLSHSLGKPVDIKTEGERLEIDRNLIKKLEEPLMHLVRNALDHGIEPAGQRLAAGKPETGTISISATRHGSTIMISVTDDGGGLRTELILERAIERGLVSREAAGTLSDAQIHDFIFQAGFSTSESVSQVSGRGVGMDIVKSMVIASRGAIRIQTAPGKGTIFAMTFPISTAIIDGLIVRVGTNSLIVPVVSVVESLKVPVSALSWVNGSAELITIRDKVLPVLRLDGVLGMAEKTRLDRGLGIGVSDLALTDEGRGESAMGRKKGAFLIGLIVENSEGQPYFLVIDEVLAKKEVVVKPLGPRFRNMRGITSGTVLAGGAIGLVLDVDQVVNLSVVTNRETPTGQ